jgi:site-specific recombinase XerD
MQPEKRLFVINLTDVIEIRPSSASCLVSEWLANLDNNQTRRAYRSDIQDFFVLVGARSVEDLLEISRGHVLMWRAALEKAGLSAATRRRKLAALACLFDYLIEHDQRHTRNPVRGVKRPRTESHEGKTPALNSTQAKLLLEAPNLQSAKGLRDRAILAVLLYHGLRRQEVTLLKISDLQMRDGIQHLRIHGKGGKLRYIPLHGDAAKSISLYLERTRTAGDKSSFMFTGLRGSKAGRSLSADGIYKLVCHYARQAGIDVAGLGVHGLRVTAATNALEHHADIAQVQHWLGHTSISTTRLYDRRQNRAIDSPSFRVQYDH